MLLVFLFSFLFQPSAAAQVKETRRVLVFNEIGLGSPGVAVIDQEIVAALEKLPYHVEFYSENLDTSLFPDEASQRDIRDWYKHKYQNHKPDLIIAIGPSPIKFMLDAHEVFAPHTPIVFWDSTEEGAESPRLDSDFTGVWGVAQPERTLDAAFRLLPGTKHVVVVGGVAPYDRHLEGLVEERFRSYESRVDFTYLTNLDMPTLLDRLKRLPSQTIVYHTSIMKDAAGTDFIDATQSVPMVASAANAPVFAVDDVDVGGGTVGGDVFSFAAEGRVAAEMAVRILNGERPQDIPVVRGANVYLFDWRALKRWDLKESDLPPGSVILNKELSFWQTYKQYIISGIFLLLAQTLIIAGLVWQRTKRKKIQTELVLSNNRLSESEERFRLVANTAPVMIWMSGVDKLCTYFNQFWLEFTGRSLEKELGNGWSEGVHSEDLERCWDTYTKAFDRRESFQMEYRLRTHNGEYCWIFDSGVPRFNADGSFSGYIGSAIDVTDRKLAEDALSSLSGRLIEAQEEERRRVARELHDDVSQKLVMLTIGLQELAMISPESQPQLRTPIESLLKSTSEVSDDVHALSHRLHSSKLELVGLAGTIRSFCQELAKQRDVEIDFAHSDVPNFLPSQVSLCLFRILQEGLGNAVKHSGVQHFEVRLERVADELQLTIRDSGVGFDPSMVIHNQGLGLISMRERVNLVKGTLSIVSVPGGGTQIQVRVPIAAQAGADQKSASA